MRFIFLTLGYHPDLDGGAYRYAAEVAERLAARGHEVQVITTNPENKLPPTEDLNGVRIRRLRSAARGIGGFSRNLSERNLEAHNILIKIAGLGAPKTLVASHHAYFESAQRDFVDTQFFHGPWGLEYRLAQKARSYGFVRRLLDPVIAQRMHRLEANALGRCRRILVASEYIKTQLAGWHHGVAAPVEVVGGGVNFDQFAPARNRARVRSTWKLDSNAFLFLTVRRLDPRMGLLSVVAAFGKIAATEPRARLWLAGRGPQESEIKKVVEKLGLGEKVRLLGFVPEADLPSLYQAADCTLMPSLDLEGFGLATAESLACGTPVLASNAAANPEVVRPLGEQLLFPKGDVEALATRMAGILSGAVALPSREECVTYARSRFSWDRPVNAFEAAHRRACGVSDA
jgi:glycosyltransferase involved in cell wall biosynthesis